MVALIKRMTTEFIEGEDRLRISGEIDNAPPVMMWLTQRLAGRLLSPLLQWLDRQAGVPLRREIIHGFAQEAAVAGLKPQAPVQAASGQVVWLIEAIDIVPAEESIALAFRAGVTNVANVSLTAQELRQWLAIVYVHWLNAGWPTALWPEWIQGEVTAVGQQVILH